jgi:hypothetical protein
LLLLFLRCLHLQQLLLQPRHASQSTAGLLNCLLLLFLQGLQLLPCLLQLLLHLRKLSIGRQGLLRQRCILLLQILPQLLQLLKLLLLRLLLLSKGCKSFSILVGCCALLAG